MTYTTKLTVRSYELDNYNHVNNAVYLNYLEYARMDFLKTIGFPYQKMLESGFGLLVSEISIKFKTPAVLYEELEISISPVKKNAVSGIWHQVISCGNRTVVDAEVTWVSVDTNSGRPVRLPPEFDRPEFSPDFEPAKIC